MREISARDYISAARQLEAVNDDELTSRETRQRLEGVFGRQFDKQTITRRARLLTTLTYATRYDLMVANDLDGSIGGFVTESDERIRVNGMMLDGNEQHARYVVGHEEEHLQNGVRDEHIERVFAALRPPQRRAIERLVGVTIDWDAPRDLVEGGTDYRTSQHHAGSDVSAYQQREVPLFAKLDRAVRAEIGEALTTVFRADEIDHFAARIVATAERQMLRDAFGKPTNDDAPVAAAA